MTTRAPRAFIVRTRVRAPGLRVMRLSTSAITLAGRPASSATRSRSAGSNAISPRIAHSVMAATRAPAPAQAASSSTHS